MSLPRSAPARLLSDPAFTFAADLLEPSVIAPQLEALLGPLELRGVTLLRHKQGKRALIAYDLERPTGALRVLGKVRAKGTDRATQRLQAALWQGGFSASSVDGVSVAEPLGTLELFQMTLQRAVPGVGLETLLCSPAAAALMPHVAAAAHKLHRSNVATHRQHTVADELLILRRQLEALAQGRPHWAKRLKNIRAACVRLASILPASRMTLLHRDFYPEQLFVHGERLYLLDLDLCAIGDPALDLGNFTAHLSEYALRTAGDVGALTALETGLTEHFCTLSGVSARAISTYHTLSLARHIAISWRMPTRRHLTQTLLELVEARLAAK